MKTTVSLGELISPAPPKKCGDGEYPVLSMTMHDGIVLQSNRFKKNLASADTSNYKIVQKNQLVEGFPIDEGVIYVQKTVDSGIMSPAYKVWDIDTGKIEPDFLELALHSEKAMQYYRTKLRGTTARRRSLPTPTLLAMEILLPSKQEQRHSVRMLNDAQEAINTLIGVQEKIDQLVKSRFVEMFGDPVTNPHDWEKVPLSDLAEIKIGPFGTLLHKDDYVTGGHPLVNPSHIHDGTIVTDGKLTISDEKYEELSAYHLFENDVVMGRRGEMGRCAVVKEAGLLCGTGSMIIRSLGEVRADFLQKIISFPSFKKTIEDMAVGQTMPNLNVPIVSRLEIIKPPTEVQDAYYDFVALADKSKLVVQELLAKCELLRGKVMQEYFE